MNDLYTRNGDRFISVYVKDLAHTLPPTAFQTISWREGSNETLSGHFAVVRVRHASGNSGKARLRPEQWLLIEWPPGDADPLNLDPAFGAFLLGDA